MPRALVKVLAHTPDPERAVAVAARLCYSPRSVETLSDSLTGAEIASLIDKIVEMGHYSPLEHAVFTFGIDNISRACSHQLVRHRVASYSQQSQRYVKLDKVSAIVPPSIEADHEAKSLFEEKLRELWAFYSELVERGVAPEDARYILPNACETKIIVTMNARELHHFFALRLCHRAQWEIRDMALEVYKAIAPIAPGLFKGAGPGCVKGACPEGEYSCGRAKEVRAELSQAVPA
ncbi:MAG: thymidylate synthase (FAD) [Deltaproteobacteria bacterium]|nr:MAG: thymidylate synthase (FAD) [Deltaproteobacteria bacterium]